MKGKVLSAVVLLAAAGTAAAVLWRHRDAAEEHGIRVSGTVEATEAELGFAVAGLLAERRVSEGDRVEAGAVLARLDDAELRAEVDRLAAALAELEAGARKQEIARAEAAVQAARAQLAELEAGARKQEIAQAEAAAAQARARWKALEAGSRPQEIAVARAAVRAAEAERERLASEAGRMTVLAGAGSVPERDLEAVLTARKAAEEKLVEARERLRLAEEGPRAEAVEEAAQGLRKAEEALSLVKAGPREEAVARARAALASAEAALALTRAGPRRERLDQARAALRLGRQRLSRAELRSPLSGVVLVHALEPGEFAQPGTPVLTVARTDTVWIRAYIEETDLGRVKLGSEVEVRTDTYPEKTYPGRLTYIASEAEFTPKNVQTRKQRVKLVYRVKITVPNPDGELKPGMPADGRILNVEER